MALDRAVRRPAGNPALRQSRGGPVRSAAATSRFETRVTDSAFRRGRRPLDVRTDHGDTSPPALRHGDRLPVRRARARLPGLGSSRARPTTPATGRTRASISPDCAWRDRHRLLAIQAIPVIAAQAAHLTVFQRTPNFCIPSRNGPLADDLRAAWKDDYPATPRGGPEYAQRHPGQSERRLARRDARGTPRASMKQRWATGGTDLHGRVQRPDLQQGGQRHRRRIRARQDPEMVKDPATAELLAPTRPSDRHQTYLRRYAAITRPTTAPNVAPGRCPRRADRGNHAGPAYAPPTANTTSTPSCSPPGSTR